MRSIGFLFLIICSISANAGLGGLLQRPEDPSKAEVLKEAEARYAETDTAGFCHRNIMIRYLSSLSYFDDRKNPQSLITKPTSELERLADIRRHLGHEAVDEWSDAMISTPNSRTDSVEQLYHDVGRLSFEFEKPRAVSESFRSDLKESLDHVSFTDISEKIRQHLSSGKFVACAEESLAHLAECQRGLDILQPRLAPTDSGNGNVTRADLYISVLGNKNFDEGLRLAALKITHRLKEPSLAGDVFSDLRESFRKSGLSPANSENAAWATMGLVATGGQNLVHRLVTLGNFAGPDGSSRTDTPKLAQNAAALSLISVGMTAIDSKRDRLKQPLYSYPHGILTACDNAKPYHFWLAAFDARELILRDHLSPKAAAMASFATEKGYQATRSSMTSGNGEAMFSGILSYTTYSAASQIVRTDLAYAAAGAEYGARSVSASSNSTIDVNKALVALIRASTLLAPVSPAAQAKMSVPAQYLQWKRLFAPDIAFEAVEK